MVKRTETIRVCFNHFVGLTLKGLNHSPRFEDIFTGILDSFTMTLSVYQSST